MSSRSTRAHRKLITGSSYGFNEPAGIASDATHVWVANHNGNSVTELSAKAGALVAVISERVALRHFAPIGNGVSCEFASRMSATRDSISALSGLELPSSQLWCRPLGVPDRGPRLILSQS